MAHPYFDTLSFPFGRREAAEFLTRVSAVIPDIEAIKALYEDSGGDLSVLNTTVAPVYVWRQVLRNLTRERALEKLCKFLLEGRNAPVLGDATRAIVNAGTETIEISRPVFLEPSDPRTQNTFARNVIDAAPYAAGITVFVSPYAAYDVDQIGDPRQLARLLLAKSFDELAGPLGSDKASLAGELGFDSDSAVLSNLLVATSSGRAMSVNYELLWQRMCDIADAEAGKSRLYQELADLARIWEEAAEIRASNVAWPGLMFVTLGMDSHLENELADARIEFGVLNVLADRRVSYHSYERRDRSDRLEFKEEWTSTLKAGRGEASGPLSGTKAIKGGDYMPPHRVVVVKLMGLSQLRDSRPSLGLEMLNLLRTGASLPTPIENHLKGSPFVMLGGGLFDPFVALAFEAYFRTAGPKGGRWLVLHPPLPDDMLRVTEYAINRFDPKWADNIYDLDLLVEDLTTIVGKMSERILQNNQQKSGA